MIARTYAQVAPELARVSGISGMRVTDARVLDRVNLAQEKLANEGDWVGTTARIRFCVQNECIALPYEFEALMHVALDRQNIPVLGKWFEFLGYGSGHQDKNATVLAAYERNESPVFSQPCGKRVRVYSFGDERVDNVRPSIRIFGTDTNDHPLRHEVSPGVFADGIDFVLNGDNVTNYADDETVIKTITQVKKPRTKFPVEVHYLDEDDVEFFGARYWHWVENPLFRIYYVPGVSAEGSTIHAIVRRRFIPVHADAPDTPMFITNLPALRKAVMSISKEDAGDILASQALLGSAVSDLKKEKSTYDRSLKPVVDPTHQVIGFRIPHVV